MSLDKDSVQFMDGTGSEVEERSLFNKIFQVYERKDEKWFWIWGIFDEDELCGHVELKETEHTLDGELEIVYMIHPDKRRQGIMTDVLSSIKQQQQSWGKRIIASVSPDNVASISLLKKWGVDKKVILTDTETGEDYLKLVLSK